MNNTQFYISILLKKYEQLHSEKISNYGNNEGFTIQEEQFMLGELNLLYSIKEDLQNLFNTSTEQLDD